MFIISLEYLKPVSEVDKELPAHVAFLEKYLADGTFLVAGRKEPRTGGIIIARAKSKEALSAIAAQDPFVSTGLAKFEITEFVPARQAKTLSGFTD